MTLCRLLIVFALLYGACKIEEDWGSSVIFCSLENLTSLILCFIKSIDPWVCFECICKLLRLFFRLMMYPCYFWLFLFIHTPSPSLGFIARSCLFILSKNRLFREWLRDPIDLLHKAVQICMGGRLVPLVSFSCGNIIIVFFLSSIEEVIVGGLFSFI